MTLRLDEKKVSGLIDKYRGVAIRAGKRAEVIEERAEKFAAGVLATFEVTGMAFSMGFLRGYYGPKAVVWEIPIDAGTALLLHGVAFGLGFTGGRFAQMAATNLHNLANGAMACWAASIGAEYGLKKRPEEPAPVQQNAMPPAIPVSSGATVAALPPAQPPPYPEMAQPQWPSWTQQPSFNSNPMTQEELAAAMNWRAAAT